MSRSYTYIGEAETVVPFTVDGPRVLSAGDVVTVSDEESLDGHPLFVPEGEVVPSRPVPVEAQAGSETAAPAVPVAVPAPVEIPAPAEEAVAEPVPVPADPSAQAAAGQE